MPYHNTVCSAPTPKQQELLDWIEDFVLANGYPPTTREMMRELGLHSPTPVQNRLAYLKRLGLIDWDSNRARTIKVLKPRDGNVQVMGEIAAGSNSTVFLSTPEKLDFPDAQPGDFALYVKDNSLSGEFIKEGDTGLFRAIEDPAEGKIVAFRTIYSARMQIRRYSRSDDRIVLEAASEGYLNLSFSKEEVRILGVLIGIWRAYI